MKINVMEYGFNKEKNTVYPREFCKGVKVIYDKPTDTYMIKYKNQTPPVKHDYVINGIMSVINYENSFIPIKVMDFVVVDVDSLGKVSLALRKVKLERVKKTDRSTELQLLKDQVLGLQQQVGGNMIDPIKQEDTKDVSEINEVVLKMCAIPMGIRSYYLLQLKRLHEKSLGWFQRYQTILMFMMFAIITVTIVYIAFDQGSKYAVDAVNAGMNIFNKIQILAVRNETSGFVPVTEAVTTTTTKQGGGFLPFF